MPRRPRDQVSKYEKRLPAPGSDATAPSRQQLLASTGPHQRHGDRSSGDDDATRYLTGPQVCARYGITDMSLWRWLNDAEINFPQPTLRIRDRRFWLEAELIAWERSMLPGGDSARHKQREAETA
jgi:predicted DNA-binding transcriptional regulator AlpA